VGFHCDHQNLTGGSQLPVIGGFDFKLTLDGFGNAGFNIGNKKMAAGQNLLAEQPLQEGPAHVSAANNP